MHRKITLKYLKSFLLLSIVSLFGASAQAAFVNLPVTGYNADVIANGTGTAASSITADVDGAGYAFMAADFNPLGALPTAYLPPSGIIYSVATSGVTFQLQPYTANNSLRIATTGSGTLTVTTPQSVSDIYLLAVSGSGATAANITVTFTDATTQVFTSTAVPDWYGGANFALRGLGRVNVASNGIDNNPSDPRLYEIKLSLSPANYNKQIASIGFVKTITGGVINVMGVAVNTVTTCAAPAAQPYALLVAPGSTTATVTFNASIPAADKYLVVRTPLGAALSTPPVNGTAYTVGGTLGNGTILSASNSTSIADAGLTASTQYGYTIFAYNDICSGGPNYNTTNALFAAATTTAVTYTNVPATGYNADVVANGTGTAASSITADVDGAGYAFMAANFNPLGTTPTQFMPTSGIVNSNATSGLSFTLQPYTANNSLRLPLSTTGTLTLATPIAASDLYLLAVSGSGASTTVTTVTFTDASTQVFTPTVPDWYNGTPYAILGLGRVNVASNGIDNNTTNPRLYEVRLTISAANYGKQIASVTVQNTTTGGGIINVMGMAANLLPPCITPASQPTSMVLIPSASTAYVSFNAASPAVNKYMIVRTPGSAALSASPANGTIYTVGAALGNGTIVSLSSNNSITDAGLTSSTQYRYTVFPYNDLCGGGPLYNTAAPLSGTVTTNGVTTYTWTGATNFTWTIPTNWTPARNAPDPTDILLFNNGLTNAVYGIPTQTVGRIAVSNNTTAMFQSSVAVTLIIASDNNAATNELDIASGSTLLVNGSASTTSSLTLAYSGTGATANIAGTLEAFGLTSVSGSNFINCANAVTTVTSTGTIAEGGTQTSAEIINNTTANLIINGTFNYKYSNTSNPAMPVATWNTGSTAIISGLNTATGGPNGGLNQVFYNFTYDCKSQTSNTNWSGTGPLAATGTFTMSSTGTGTLQFASTQGYSYQVNNYNHIGGTLNLNSGTATATPQLSISGTFNQTGGTLTATGASTGTNAPTLNFNGTGGAQNVTFLNAAPTGPIVYRISNAAGINLLGAGTLTSNFNINNNGGVRISTPVANPVNTTLTLVYGTTGTTLTYDASASLTMTAAVFPTASGPVNLYINTGGSANLATMPFSRTIPGTLTMLSGDADLGANTLTLGTSSASPGTLAYTAGSLRLGTGSFVRWYGTTGLPTAPGTAIGFYPVAYGGFNRNVALYFATTTALTTGGTIGVTHTNVPGFTNGLSVADLPAYTITTRTNSSWSFANSGLVLGGTMGMRLTGQGLFTSANPANLRAMQANAVAGTHVNGSGFSAQRSGLTLTDISVPYYIGAAAADINGVYTAINSGNWTTGATWDIGVAPGVTNDAFINPNVVVTSNSTSNTAKSLGILPGGTLSIGTGNAVTIDQQITNNGTVNISGGDLKITNSAGSGLTNAGGAQLTISSGNLIDSNALVSNGTITLSGGTFFINGVPASTTGVALNAGSLLNQSGGTMTLGPTGGGSRAFNVLGTQNVSGGTLNINGSHGVSGTGVFSQTGGFINVDGNAGGVLANSVPCGTPIVYWQTSAITLSAGTFTIVDPHACTTGTNTLSYGNTSTHVNATGTHIFRMGDGISADPGGQTPYNFSVNTSITSAGKLAFNDLVINTGTAVNSYFLQGSSTMGVLGNFTINNGGEYRFNPSGILYLNGNMTVNTGGTLTTGTSALYFGSYASATVAPATSTGQTVSGGGTFRNLPASPTANFSSLQIRNSNGVFLNLPGTVAFSGTTTFLAGSNGPSILAIPATSILSEIAGAGQSGAGQTTGWLNGRYQKAVGTLGGFNGTFPIGDASYYAFINIPTATVTATGAIWAGTTTGDHPSIGTSLINPTRSVNRYYTMQAINGLTFTTGSLNATFNWNAADVDAGANPLNFKSGFYNSGWTYPTVGTAAATSMLVTGLAPINGDYAFGEQCSPIIIGTQPVAQTVCAGSAAAFSVVLTGSAGITYQWKKNGINISGATSSVYTIPATAAADAGSYTVTISSQCPSVAPVTSTAVALVVNTPASISTQPVSQGICQGSGVTFSVVAAGTGISYQWQKNGTPITGATGTSYSISTVVPADAGSYTVLVTGTSPCGNITSSAAVLTVNPLPLTITPATSATFCTGGSVVLNATPGFTYQWKLNGVNITGATSAAYTASATGSYTVFLSTAAGCSGTSNAIAVLANSAPVSTISPAGSVSFCAGASTTLTGPAVGGLTYQWNLNGSPISGATNSTYSATLAGSYTLTVALGTGCNATSAPTVASINPLPTATATPAGSTTICQGSSVTLNANTGAGITYVWNLNGVPVTPAATGSSIAANAVGTYTVTVTTTATGCQNTSAGVPITINPLPVATVSPATATTFCQGGSVVLNANTGTGLTYVWNVNGAAITPAATSASYSATATGNYTVTVTNTPTGCSQTSAVTTVQVNPLPNVTVTAGGTLNICQGSGVTLSVPTVTGMTYQWLLNAGNISGATGASYIATAAGTYTVLVTNTATTCTAASAGSVVTVIAAPIANITAPAAGTTICQGDTVKLNANTGAGLSYQWSLNGSSISGATSALYNATIAGAYTVTETNTNGCSATSGAVNVTVNPRPSSQITYNTPVVFCQGGAVVLTATVAAGVTYQWSNNGVPVAGSTGTSTIISTSGSYTVTLTNTFGCSAISSPVNVVVNPAPVPLITAIHDTLSTGSYATYQWYFNGQPIGSATTQKYIVPQNGSYSVFVTDVNGCTNFSPSFYFGNLSVSGVIPAAAVKVYPNPVYDIVYVDAPAAVTIIVRDLTGRTVLHAEHATQVDMTPIADGAYLMQITDMKGNTVKVEKLMKSTR